MVVVSNAIHKYVIIGAAFFWSITQPLLVIHYLNFGKTQGSHL